MSSTKERYISMMRFSLMVLLAVQMSICTAAQQSTALQTGHVIKFDHAELAKKSWPSSDIKTSQMLAAAKSLVPLTAALPSRQSVLVNFYTAQGTATPLLVNYHLKTELPAQNSKL